MGRKKDVVKKSKGEEQDIVKNEYRVGVGVWNRKRKRLWWKRMRKR